MPEPTLISQRQIRDQFPALENGFAFFENAGGAQMPVQVLCRMNHLLMYGYAQIGADYPASDFATKSAQEANQFANVLMNGEGTGDTLIGPSTTDLIYRVANAYADVIEPGDEIVVSLANHESHIGPWMRLEKAGAKFVWWGVDPETGEYSYDEVGDLLGPKTRLVLVGHTSNLLGDIMDVGKVADMTHAVGARIIVDGVAYAAHQSIDVKAWDSDFYAFSFYKAYGPHLAAIYGKHEAWAELTGPNHFFIPDDQFPWKFELGCQPYESMAGVLGLGDYLAYVAGELPGTHGRQTVEAAFRTIRDLEVPVQTKIMDFLATKPSIRLVGPQEQGVEHRHPTICFIHETKNSAEVVGQVNDDRLGIRYGHMYAARLCKALGAPTDTGFVRVSAVHYNTLEEADLLIERLDQVL